MSDPLATKKGELNPNSILHTGGEIGHPIDEFDWSSTPLGPISNWSPAVRNAIHEMLANGSRNESNSADGSTTSSIVGGQAPRVELAVDERALILIVGHDTESVRSIQVILGHHYRIEVVSAGRQAMEAIRDKFPDLVLIAVASPGLENFELVKAIRSSDPTQSISVILLLEGDVEKSLMESQKSGADDFLTRPFSEIELIASITAQVQVARVRRHSAELQRWQQEELQEIQRIARIGSWRWDAKTKRTTVSDELYSIYGLDPTLPFPTFREQDGLIYPHEEWLRIKEAGDKALQTGVGFQLDVQAFRNSETIWITARSEAVMGPLGEIVALRGTVQDITDRKCAEEAIHQRVEEFQTLLDTVPIGIFVAHDPDCKTITGNRASNEMLRSPASRNLSLSAAADQQPTNFRICRNGAEYLPDELPVQRASRGEVVRHEELEVVFDDGGVIHEWISATPLYDSHGRVRGAVAAALDITERKRAEALVAGQKLVLEMVATGRSLNDILNELVKVIEAQESALLASVMTVDNEQRIRIGAGPSLPKDYFVALDGLSIHPPYAGPCARTVDLGEGVVVEDMATDHRWSAEWQALAFANGLRSCRSEPVKSSDGRILGTFAVYRRTTGDPLPAESPLFQLACHLTSIVIQRNQWEEALRKSEARFRLAAEAVNGIIYEFDLTNGNVERTRGLFEVLGYDPAEVPSTAAWWWEQVHPEDRETIRHLFESARTNNVISEYRVRHKEGHWIVVEDRAMMMRDAAGNPLRMVGCSLDVTEIRLVTEKLKEADRRKDEFLATLAHELRNPLAPLRTGLQIMKLSAGDAAVVNQSRTMMERQVNGMAHLIDDLMDLSRISRGKVILQKSTLRLNDALHDALETTRPLLDERRHELTVDVPSEAIYVEGDRIRLAQVFGNLLNNAAKYTDQAGRIRLAVKDHGDETAVIVEDNGVGIPPEMLTRVFGMFSQVDRSLEKSQGGLGIGLHIVKSLIEMHGGSIVAESSGYNTGSRFIVRLPVVRGAIGNSSSDQEDAPHKPTSRRRILIADDNRDAANSLSMLLRTLGNDTRTARDGLEALAIGVEFQPEVVLLDIGMPKLNGLDACRIMREEPWGQQAIFVACTGWGQENNRKESEEAGFDHHLVKPLDLEELMKLLAVNPAGGF